MPTPLSQTSMRRWRSPSADVLACRPAARHCGGQQVAQHTLQQHGVGDGHGQRVSNVHGQAQTTRFCLRCPFVSQALQQRRQQHGVPLRQHGAGIHARHVQQRGEHRVQRCQRSLHALCDLGLLGRQRASTQSSGVQAQGVRGLAQVVAGGSQETRLGLVGGLGGGLRLLQLQLRLLKLGGVPGQALLQIKALGLAGLEGAHGDFDHQQGERQGQHEANRRQPNRQGAPPEPNPGREGWQGDGGQAQHNPPLPTGREQREQAQRAQRTADPPRPAVVQSHPNPPALLCAQIVAALRGLQRRKQRPAGIGQRTCEALTTRCGSVFTCKRTPGGPVQE